MYELWERTYSESYTKGRAEGVVSAILALLKRKLGNLSEEVIERIKGSTQDQLKELTIDIFDIENEEDVIKVLSSDDTEDLYEK